MIGIARNKLLMSFRRGRVEARARHRLGFQAVALDDGDLDRIEEVARGDGGRLAALVEDLPEDERYAVRSRVLEDRPYREIATELRVLGVGDPQAREPRAGADARSAEGDRIDVNDYLDRVEAQLTELTERGAHQRLRARRPALARATGGAREPRRPRGPRRRSEALAFLAAAAVVAAVVGIVLVNAHTSKPHHVPSSAPAGTRSKSTTTAQPRPHHDHHRVETATAPAFDPERRASSTRSRSPRSAS